jgi:hypothetical protein
VKEARKYGQMPKEEKSRMETAKMAKWRDTKR